ncbi:MAG: SRPBCC domain-containing protein [Patescibacteria group bacterium]|mgnify:CR=1 FL=1
MQKIQHSIFINAPVEKVWNTMLDDATYREWTKPFNPGSFYEGDWSKGSIIKFLGVDESGEAKMGGMYSRIAENRRHEFISIEHIGLIDAEGNVDTTSDEVKKWTPAFENYTFTEKDGGTEVLAELDISEEHKDVFNDMWPKALKLLKELSEK